MAHDPISPLCRVFDCAALCFLQELLDHLEGMLSNEAVIVTVGQAIVEVKPQVSHHTFAVLLQNVLYSLIFF